MQKTKRTMSRPDNVSSSLAATGAYGSASAASSPGKSTAVVATARKFLQRSFSLRSKGSPVALKTRGASGKQLSCSPLCVPSTDGKQPPRSADVAKRNVLQVVITKRDLIISASCPPAEFDSKTTAGGGGGGGRSSRTLSRHESLRKQRSAAAATTQPADWSWNTGGNVLTTTVDGSNTLFINGPVPSPPPPALSSSTTSTMNCSARLDRQVGNETTKTEMKTQADTNAEEEDVKGKAASTLRGFSDDEGVDTSANVSDEEDEEDEEDEDEDDEDEEEDYVNLELDQVGGHRLCRQVTLARSSGGRGLGLTIEGGADCGRPVIIVRVADGGAADRSRALFVGDRIVSVNGVPINETTAHTDVCRLLADCGEIVNLVVRHTNAVTKIRKFWRRATTTSGKPIGGVGRQSLSDLSQKVAQARAKAGEQFEQPLVEAKVGGGRALLARNGMSHSLTSLAAHYMRIDLFGASVSWYVAYSDRLRDGTSFELATADGGHLVVQCANMLSASQWADTILATIERLTTTYLDYYNKHYSQREHFFYMGWVSECVANDSSASLVFSPISAVPVASRWLWRYMILKGGQCWLFKRPPTDLLLAAKRRLALSVARRAHHSASSGSSLGSVISSNTSSTESEPSRALGHGNADSVSRLSRGGGGGAYKTDRLSRLNRELERELTARALVSFECSKADFRVVREGEQRDAKQACFLIFGEPGRGYFSTEDHRCLADLQRAWSGANYQSVIRVMSKTFTVRNLCDGDGEDVLGSLTLDWRRGFAFYSPKTKQLLWSYKFHQLKTSSDDGKARLSLTFVVDPSDSRVVSTYVLECSCLQTLIYSIHAFLSAKVYSLHL